MIELQVRKDMGINRASSLRSAAVHRPIQLLEVSHVGFAAGTRIEN